MTWAASSVPPAPDVERALRERHAGARILVAEDNPINQEVAVEMLEHVGLATLQAVDGLAALGLLAQGGIQLVLMDVNMPRMDGLEATRRIRGDPRFASIPVLAMTANVFEADQRACRDAGMNDFIGKPIDGHLLYSLLLRWLDVSRAATGSAAPAPTAGADPIVAPLAGWDELDTARGLRSLNGRGDRYLKLLGRMIDLHGGDPQALQAAWQRRDRAELRRMAHKLRGTAAMLGAMRVADLAQWLDSPAPDASTEAQVQCQVSALEQALQSLFEGLRSRAGIGTAGAPPTSPPA